MSLTTQVESLSGAIPGGVDINTELTNGAKDVIRRVELANPKELWLFTKSTAVTSAGLGIDYGMVYDVSRGSKPCSALDVNKRHRAAESDSIEYATGEFPIYYLLNGKVFVLPEPGAGADIDISSFATYDSGNKTTINATAHGFVLGDYVLIAQSEPSNPQYYVGTFEVSEFIDVDNFIISRDYSATVVTGYSVSSPAALAQHLALPAVDGNQNTAGALDNFPQSYTSLVVTYGAMVVVLSKMADLHDVLPALTLPVVSVAPELSTVTESLPSYTAPSAYVSPAAPTTANVDFSDVPSVPSYTGPVKPNLPVLTHTISEDDFISAITALPLSVEIPAPPISPSFLEGVSDFSTARSKVPQYVPPVFTPPQLPTIPALIVPPPPSDLDAAGFSSASSSSAASNRPTYTVPVLNPPDFTYIEDTLIKSEEDAELAASMIQSFQSKLQLYQAELQDAVNVFNQENAVYQAENQEGLANAKIGLDRENQEYQANLARHNTEIQSYQAAVNTEVQKWTKDNIEHGLNLWNQKYNNYMNTYQQDMANNINQFNKEVQEYQAEVSKAAADASNLMTRENNEYAASLQKFNSELQEYQFRTAHDVTEWQAKVVSPAVTKYQQSHNDEMQEWQGENTRLMALYQGEAAEAAASFDTNLKVWSQEITKAFTEHSQETSLELQQYQANVQAEAGRYQADAERSTSLHKAQTEKFQADIQDIQAENADKMAKHSAELQRYQAEATALAGEFQAKVEKKNVEYQWLHGKYGVLEARYESGFLTQPKKEKE